MVAKLDMHPGALVVRRVGVSGKGVVLDWILWTGRSTRMMIYH